MLRQPQTKWIGLLLVIVLFLFFREFSSGPRYTPTTSSTGPSAKETELTQFLEKMAQENEKFIKQNEELIKQNVDLQKKMAERPPTMSANGLFRNQDIMIEPLTEALRNPDWKKIGDVENRDHIQFKVQHVNYTNAPRKIYLDLGLSTFYSSIGWFHDNYPMKFDKIYGWEVSPTTFQFPADMDKAWKDTIKVYTGTFVGTKDVDSPKKMDFVRWFKEEVDPKEEDFIMMKMDIEEGEWEVLPYIEKSGMYKYLDEVFVEIHYKGDYDLDNFHGWKTFEKTKEQAIALLNHWRYDLDVYIHYWP